MSEDNKQAVDGSKKTIRLFLILFIVIGALLSGAITLIYQMQTESYIERLKVQELSAVKGESQLIEHIFQEVVADLKFLARQPSLQNYLNHGRMKCLRTIEQGYLVFARAKRNYDQVRFLNAEGMEIVRVDYRDGHPVVIPRTELQDKSKRYYFTDTYALGLGLVFVSPLDLNMEHGQIEKPLKPMIRFGMPVFDQEGKKRGIVLLNYLGTRLLDMLEQTGEAMLGQPLLANSDGYWLLGPTPEDAWGFMLPEGENKTLYSSFPVSASQITSQTEGQLLNKEGLFSLIDVHPLQDNNRSSTGAFEAHASSRESLTANQYHWKLISYIGRDDLDDYSLDLLVKLTFFGAGLFLLTASASWVIASAIVRKRVHRAELYNLAHFDALTGLPNRTLYFDRLNQTYESSKRHQRIFAILYIDLDDFKKVNDTMGHDAGDMLLKEVSDRMLGMVRKSDTVGRMGGDEFMVILTDLSQYHDAEEVAAKLLEAITRPVKLSGGEAVVGACIGIVVYPHDSEDMEELVKMADEAMYVCKAEGKNVYKTYLSLHSRD